MTKFEFRERIDACLRRLNDLRAAERGEMSLKRVSVKPYAVSAYKVGAHFRYISATRRGTVASRKVRVA